MRSVAPGSVAAELIEDADEQNTRYVLPAPEGSLALVAEFTTPDGRDPEVVRRIEALMVSFRWAA